MGFENYNYNGNNHYSPKRKSSKLTIFVVVLFLSVVGVIYFTTFSDGFSFTGRVVGSQNSTSDIVISSALSVPELNLKGSYNELVLSLSPDSFIYLDNKKVGSNFSNELILRDFNGIVNIQGGKGVQIEGKISEIVLNGIPITSNTNSKMKLSLSPNSHYNSIEIKEGFYFKELIYIASGEIYYGEDFIKLNSEKVDLTNYIGSLKIEDDLIFFDGTVESLSVTGDSRKITLLR